jgi:tetratricopeptide (TPR) repeat protein
LRPFPMAGMHFKGFSTRFFQIRGGCMPSRRKLMWVAAGLLILSWFNTGCVSKDMMIKSMDPIMDDMNLAINRNPDVEIVRDAIPAGLIQLDGFITSAPNNKILLRAAEGYFGYSFAFVEEKDRERAGALYIKARNYALRALVGTGMSSLQFPDKPLDKFTAALGDFDRRDVPALYWSASCWMAWAGLNVHKPEVLLAIPKIEAMLLRSIELDETYYNGGAHAALGAFYASRAKVIGGDPDKAGAHFKRAFEISDSKVLFFHLLYAQYYCYQIQDRDLFEKTLNQVVSVPVDYYPDKNFPNEVAKRKARVLLNKIDDIF